MTESDWLAEGSLRSERSTPDRGSGSAGIAAATESGGKERGR